MTRPMQSMANAARSDREKTGHSAEPVTAAQIASTCQEKVLSEMQALAGATTWACCRFKVRLLQAERVVPQQMIHNHQGFLNGGL